MCDFQTGFAAGDATDEYGGPVSSAWLGVYLGVTASAPECFELVRSTKPTANGLNWYWKDEGDRKNCQAMINATSIRRYVEMYDYSGSIRSSEATGITACLFSPSKL